VCVQINLIWGCPQVRIALEQHIFNWLKKYAKKLIRDALYIEFTQDYQTKLLPIFLTSIHTLFQQKKKNLVYIHSFDDINILFFLFYNGV